MTPARTTPPGSAARACQPSGPELCHRDIINAMSQHPESSETAPCTIYLMPDATPPLTGREPSFRTTRAYLWAHIPYFKIFFESGFTSSNVLHLDSKIVAPECLEHILKHPDPDVLPASITPEIALNLALAADYLLITPLYEACRSYLGSIRLGPNEIATSLRLLCTEEKFYNLCEALYRGQIRTLAVKPPRLWKKPILDLPETARDDLLQAISAYLDRMSVQTAISEWKDLCTLRRAVQKVNRERVWNDTILNDLQDLCEKRLMKELGRGSNKIIDLLEDGVGGEVRELLFSSLGGKWMNGSQAVWKGVRRLLDGWCDETGEQIAMPPDFRRAAEEAQRRMRQWWTRSRIDRVFMDGGFENWNPAELRVFEREMGLDAFELQMTDGRASTAAHSRRTETSLSAEGHGVGGAPSHRSPGRGKIHSDPQSFNAEESGWKSER